MTEKSTVQSIEDDARRHFLTRSDGFLDFCVGVAAWAIGKPKEEADTKRL